MCISSHSWGGRRWDPNEAQLLLVCNILLAANERDSKISGHRIDFSTSQKSVSSNGFFTASRLQEMFEVKDQFCFDVVLIFLAAFL